MTGGLSDKQWNTLQDCLSTHFETPVQISDIHPLYGGASRILALFKIKGEDDPSFARRLVLRMDPPSSFVESEREKEFAALEALHKTKVPVPEPIFLDSEGDLLGAPFFVMSEVPNGRASGFFDIEPYGSSAAIVGEDVFTAMGHLATIDPGKHGLPDLLDGAQTNPAEHQLDHWERVLKECETEPQPILRSGIRALKRRMPAPPEKLSIVHGDFRSGNFLIDDAGHLLALLDWEFVHIGDPMEDLAWCCDSLWAHHDPARVGGMVSLPAAVSYWENASGIKVDHDKFEWWRMFSAVRGMVMWTSSAAQFLSADAPNSAMMAFPDVVCRPVHERTIVEFLTKWSSTS